MSDTAVNVVAILANDGELLTKAADEIERLRAALQTARRDALEEAALRVLEYYAHNHIGKNTAAIILALGEKE